MTNMTDEELEDLGFQVFTKMGLTCVHQLNQVRWLDIDPSGSYSKDEHFEFDYLISHQNICLIGEITGRQGPTDVRNKYRQFRKHFNILAQQKLDERVWRLIGVPDKHLRSFREITEFRGFFITTSLQEFDVDLSEVAKIARFYKSDWHLLMDYSESIGPYAKPHFLHRFSILGITSRQALILHQDEHDLMLTQNKIVASNVGLADLYTFEASPYHLLPMTQVYRRDELPNLSSTPAMDYQRLLLPQKLNAIRRELLVSQDFMFPSSILVVLSNDCKYSDSDKTLTIPIRYGAISVIDGQHRLFSYAHKGVRKRLGDDSKIMVTAIQFKGTDPETIQRYSARTFVEINTNQTRVQPTHLDAIRYDILGETTARAIAAQIILVANKRNRQSSLYGLFDTNKTGLGIIQATTVLLALRPMANLEAIKKLCNAQSGARLRMKQGYENLFGVTIEELDQPETLINQGVLCIEHYFNLIRQVFSHDWPRRGHEINSSMRYTKMIAGFVKLLWKDFISGGFDWQEIQNELENIKENVMKLRKMRTYNDVLFLPEHSDIPDADPRDNDDYRFLSQNRHKPTSIQKVLLQSH